MHWTAFLAYRRIPANAQVIDDVRCIHCGYNLRGLRAMGNCPECGDQVSDSLFVMAKPELVAAALRSFSNSYRTLVVLAMGCFGGWMLLVAASFIAAGAFYRAWNIGEIRFRGQMNNSELLHSRIIWVWWASIFEALAALAWVAGLIALFYVPALLPYAQRGIVCFGLGWLYACILNAAAIGSLGKAMATTLGYSWMVIEFRVHRALLIVLALIAPLAFAAAFFSMSQVASVSMMALVGLAACAALVVTWVAIQHAANAAEQEYGTWDDLMDSDRIAVVANE